MNKTKQLVCWLSMFLLPIWGNTSSKHLTNNTFFITNIKKLHQDLYQQINPASGALPTLKQQNNNSPISTNSLSDFINHLLLNGTSTKVASSQPPDCSQGHPYTIPAATHTTIADGNWTNPSIWQGGNVPNNNLNGLVVNINHDVNWNGGDDLSIGNGQLNVFKVLDIGNNNLKIENSSGVVHLIGGMMIIPNGNFELNNGAVNMYYGAIQICNGNYTDNSNGGTNGTGYIFVDNGNIEDNNNGNFSTNIAWCILGGSNSGLPTSQNCSVARPTGGCMDNNFYLNQCPITTTGEKIVSGTVFNDRNEDGINNDGTALSGVTVNIYEDVNQNGQADAADNLLSTEITDVLGAYSYTLIENNSIAMDDFSSATWDGTTWGGGTGWAGGWNDDYGESGGNIGPNLGTSGGGGWNVGVIDCNQTNNHNDCEPFGTPKLSLENDDYISRAIDLSAYSAVDFSFDLETVPNNDNDDILTIKICTDNTESNCHTLFTNGPGNGNFAPSPITVNATLNDPSYLIANAHLFFHISGFSGSAEYVYIGGIGISSGSSTAITHIVIETDTATIPVNNYFTTDNKEVAVFTPTGGQDIQNDFGLSEGVRVENEVWLDLNANALQEPIEIGIANLSICIGNQAPILIDGVMIPAGGYQDTVLTDAAGIYVFENLPDCNNWQMVVHNPPTLYTATYDADAGILGTVNFNLKDGIVSQINNSWCTDTDCLDDLDFGFRLAGNNDLGGTICLDDGSKDGHCGTGGEVKINSLELLLFDEEGTFFGGVTNNNGTYLFPFLPADTYIVSLNTNQMSLDTFFLTTQLGDTPAEEILKANSAIFQKVPVLQNVFGVDYAFVPHTTGDSVVANDDVFTTCSGAKYGNWVSSNDSTFSDVYTYRILTHPAKGTVEINEEGVFKYIPSIFECGTDQFIYQLCDLLLNECDTANVTLVFEDDTPPKLTSIPADITISCDELLPDPALVSAFDNCPRIGINLTENSTLGEDGCSLYDYELTRIWTATDLCGNANSDFQTIEIKDVVAPDIFRIYTLPNGKKLVAGVAEFTGERWKTIRFPINFAEKPLVFAQVISNNDTTPVITQIRDISKAQFQIHLAEEEGNDGEHARESIAWMAMEKGSQEHDFDFIAATKNSSSQSESIDFNSAFSETPALFTTLQNTYEKDPVVVSYQQLGTENVAINLVEETSNDLETNHIAEELAYLAIQKMEDLTNFRGDIIGEVGTTTANANWSTVNLKHVYHNPVIILSTANDIANFPSTLKMENVAPNSFHVKVQGWDYLSFVPDTTAISYLVIEGSIPLYSPNFCDDGVSGVVLGEDIVAIDNCDNAVDLTYAEIKRFNGTEQVIDRTWRSSDACGNETVLIQQINCEGIAVEIKTFLQGALIGNNDDGLMRDDLRKKQLIPLEEPYASLEGFHHFGRGGGELLDAALLSITGEDAIVDWVLVEIRNANDMEEVIATSSALLQRDGDVISATGDTLIVFENVAHGDYFIGIRHRNHIGMTTKNTYTFSLNKIPEIDFKDLFTPTEGIRPGIKIGNKNAQWSGDLNGDGKTIYQGPHNDPFEMFLAIILDEANENFLVNYINRGYTPRDFNLDGVVIFQGPNNDRSNLLFNTVLAHPDNDNFLANFIVDTVEPTTGIPNGNRSSSSNSNNGGCTDADGDGLITVCIENPNGSKETKAISKDSWQDYKGHGAICGSCN